jgi:hypothetical protein
MTILGKIGRVVGAALMIPGLIIWALSNWLVERKRR